MPTSLAVVALVSIAGVTASTVAGIANWATALPFSGSALLGLMGGSFIGAGLSAAVLQKGFAVHYVAVALALIDRAVL